jgi:hypothetical protein
MIMFPQASSWLYLIITLPVNIVPAGDYNMFQFAAGLRITKLAFGPMIVQIDQIFGWNIMKSLAPILQVSKAIPGSPMTKLECQGLTETLRIDIIACTSNWRCHCFVSTKHRNFFQLKIGYEPVECGRVLDWTIRHDSVPPIIVLTFINVSYAALFSLCQELYSRLQS